MPNNEYLVDCTLFHSNGIDRSERAYEARRSCFEKRLMKRQHISF
uniref:Uncharacterized protein n=1 Tax=Physcomitrium patens TaxID=3218 RepID=A0A2K1L2P4_PHYPA|nr:hypothetical protein PHYPA_003091 [Physcomitrium patens]